MNRSRLGARIWAPAVMVLLLLGTAPKALASDTIEAEGMLQEGVIRYKVGKFEGAIRVLRRALRTTKDPALLGKINLQLGLSHGILGHITRARRSFRMALTHDPTLTLDPAHTKGAILELLAAVRRDLKGGLEVRCPLQGARVMLDGADVGTVPHRSEVPVGRHDVVVRSADGKASARSEVVVRAGRVVLVKVRPRPLLGRLSVESDPPGALVSCDGKPLGITPLHGAKVAAGLHRLELSRVGFQSHKANVVVEPGQVTPLNVPLEKAEPMASSTPLGRAVSVPREEDGQGRHRWLWTWVVAGGALAAGAAGLGVGLSLQADVDEYEALNAKDHQRLGELEEGIPQKAMATNALLGAAGGLAVTAAVIFVLEGWVWGQEKGESASESVRGAWLVPVAGSAAGVTLGGWF